VDRINFYIAVGATAAELKHAWTGYHEVAHLLIPYQGYGDAWFSEGLASYYQNVLQARGGILDEREMWQKLYEGYHRGLADSSFADKTLVDVSDQMRLQGGFMRVYWSGAWYFLAADTRLRQQSRGALTLDLALEKLNACCADQSLSVPQMVRKLDDLNRVLLFQPLYDQLIESREVPSFDSIFASLGISVLAGEVQLQDRGPGIDIRRGIALGATPSREGL
jgi:predicted metalloprotease with PDZ domain